MLDGHQGSRIRHTDADGYETTTLYDPQGRVVRVDEAMVDGVSGRSCWTYTAFSQVETHTRNCSAVPGTAQPQTVYQYDLVGRLEQETDPTHGTVLTTYTGFDEVDTVTDGNDELTDFDYDALGRVVRRTQPDGTASYLYDTLRIGALTSSANSLGGVERFYEYDAFGRIDAERTRVTVNGAMHSPTFRYTYGPGGRLYRVTYPKPSGVAAFSVSYYYDAAGYARQVVDDGTGTSLWMLAQADEASQPRVENFGNGATTARHFHPLSLKPELIETAMAGVPLQDLEYDWSAGGDLLLRHDHHHGQYEQFGYDALHRLDTTTASWGATSVGYDVLGNITQKSDVGPYSYFANGELRWVGNSGFSVLHDDAGQVTRWGPRTLTWTTAGQVRTIRDAAGTKTMSYAAEDDRVLTTDAGAKTAVVTIGDGYELRFASGKIVEWVQRVTAPTGRIVAQRTSTPGWAVKTEYTYLHDDHLGSTNVVSPANGDPADAIHVANDAWGYAREGDAWQTPFSGDLDDVGVGFTGHRAALDKGLMFMRGRMYDPRTARFMSPDPIVVDTHSVQAWNPYSYVLNRPLVFTDPTGFAPCDGECEMDPIEVNSGSGGFPGADLGAVDLSGTAGQVWDWSGSYANLRLLESIVPGTGAIVGTALMHYRAMNPIGGPNPWGDHADFRARPSLSAPSREPDPSCTGRCAYSKSLDLPYGRPLSPEQNADYDAGHVEYMNNNPGVGSVKLTMFILTAGELAMAFEGGLSALAARTAPKALPHGTLKFAGDEAVRHFGKHAGGMMQALGRKSYNLRNYLDDANHVARTGTWVPELNGFVKIIGGQGSAKAAFVGLNRATGNLTTFHIKSMLEVARKAPSLGWKP